ncbi:hypothetical protein JTE90_027675 [Oedothorax gibbosus]|uniref:Uncharacterized protein n=1 Tax=Oedothorax gibbosus TaxID=931172 RepID=A0AAV6UR02_9ARAC|nr:hypothetical protein JTE90_027675 [Oedothorax gibbosus]
MSCSISHAHSPSSILHYHALITWDPRCNLRNTRFSTTATTNYHRQRPYYVKQEALVTTCVARVSPSVRPYYPPPAKLNGSLDKVGLSRGAARWHVAGTRHLG